MASALKGNDTLKVNHGYNLWVIDKSAYGSPSLIIHKSVFLIIENKSWEKLMENSAYGSPSVIIHKLVFLIIEGEPWVNLMETSAYDSKLVGTYLFPTVKLL
jgi:hypothetical protein